MSQTIFILGRHPRISNAELAAVFPRARKVAGTRQFTILENTPSVDLARLGGVVKVGQVFATFQKFAPTAVYDFLAQQFASKTGKQIFGVSSFGAILSTNKTLLVGAKKFLRDAGVAVRFANKNFQNLTSAQTEFEILKKDGCEILIANDGRNWWFAELTGVQPFQTYARRDYAKPARDARMGMLPPKLAQILVNLACRDEKHLKVYDPFCGSGTILVEAALLGHTSLGSDSDLHAIELARQNLAAEKITAEVWQHDATQPINPRDISGGFDVVASEGTLGPPRKTVPPAAARTHIFRELAELYSAFFRELRTRRVVITFPVYLENGMPKYFSSQVISPVLEKLGWLHQKEPLVYFRPTQTVGREILIWEKVVKS